MEKYINPHDLSNPNHYENVKVELPKKCPICHVAVNAQLLYSCFYNLPSNEQNIFALYFCSSCELTFIGYYQGSKYGAVKTVAFEPMKDTEKREFSQNINSLSPDFCKIYNQAYAAEQNDLKDICGMGYRKALEFLIKDYATLQNETEKEKIANMPLSKCINEYIDNKKIRKLATASAWIGNDETHYVRKHEDYDIKDLKLFIDATASFIDSDLSALLAEQLIEDATSH